MGNLCSHDKVKIEYLENKVEEQSTSIEKMYNEYRMLKRENKYFKNRLEKYIECSESERLAS